MVSKYLLRTKHILTFAALDCKYKRYCLILMFVEGFIHKLPCLPRITRLIFRLKKLKVYDNI